MTPPPEFVFTVDVVVTTPAGHVILARRTDLPRDTTTWALPGGRVRIDESSRDAAARALAEGPGLHVDPPDLRRVDVWDWPRRDPRGRYITVAYHTVIPDPTQPAAAGRARAALWLPLSQLPPLPADHRDILAHALTSAPTSRLW
ncbi:NUDIX domain-containing protein [Streptomyces sp. NPDC001108]